MDAFYEKALLLEAQNKTLWLEYVDTKHGLERAKLLARACSAIDDCDLWIAYIKARLAGPRTDGARRALEQCICEALRRFPDNREIWEIRFAEFPSTGTFDSALQHIDNSIVWPKYLKWASDQGPEASHVLLRYLEFAPEMADVVFERLLEIGSLKTAIELFNTDPKDDFDAISVFTEAILSDEATVDLDVAVNFFQSAISLYPEHDGELVPAYAACLANSGRHVRARDILHSGLESASSIYAFGQIMDAAFNFHEALIEELIRTKDSRTNHEILIYKELLHRRPLLLSDVFIRLYPDNVEVWLNRIDLWNDLEIREKICSEALKTIAPQHAEGISRLWLRYHEIYRDAGNIEAARSILDSAARASFATLEDLENVWLERIDFELKFGDLHKARNLLDSALWEQKKDKKQDPRSVLKSLRLYLRAIELAARDDDIEGQRRYYERTFELGIATPQTVIAYAKLYVPSDMPAAFRIYERALAYFKYPAALELWRAYLPLTASVPIEHRRALFEQALESCPPNFASEVFEKYAKMECENGFNLQALGVYSRAVGSVPMSEKTSVYRKYIALAQSVGGAELARPVFDEILNCLSVQDLAYFVLAYAKMEAQAGEIERARALFAYAAEHLDEDTSIWEDWEEFELEHGDNSTLKTMLAEKQAKFKE